MQPFCCLFLKEAVWPRAGTILPSAGTSPLSVMPSRISSFFHSFAGVRGSLKQNPTWGVPSATMLVAERACFRGFDVLLRGVKTQAES
jgi:hypothetical protein